MRYVTDEGIVKYYYAGRGSREWAKTEPWVRTFYYILARTKNLHTTCKNHKRYSDMVRDYGHVKMLITKDELKHLWFRDKGFLMKRPSIDRIDSNGNYEISNCRYLEHKYNADRSRDEQKIPVVQCSISGDPIREFDSIHDAVKVLDLRKSGISKAVHGKLKTYHGHTWRLKSALQNERN
jgi:hypothetical protein